MIAFARTQEKGLLKGSRRSIQELHLRDVLDAVATRHPGMLRKFNGHAMAAGLTLAADQLELFRRAFAETVTQLAPPEIFTSIIDTDGMLEEVDITQIGRASCR